MTTSHRFALWLAVLLMLSGLFGVQAQDETQGGVYNATGTVINAAHLNVRTSGSTLAGVVAVVNRGGTYPIIGRSPDGAWWQVLLNPGGVVGWASAGYLSVTAFYPVPVIPLPPITAASIATGTVNTGGLNIRATPDPISGTIQRVIYRHDVVQLTGKTNSTPQWYEVFLADGSSGWVNGHYLDVTNDALVPIKNGVPVQASGTVNGAYFLNVRSTPNPYIVNIIAVISRGQTYPVIGKNADATWWQLQLGPNVSGWVNGRYLSVTNSHLVPITY